MFSDENNSFSHCIKVMFCCPIFIAFALFYFGIGIHIDNISDNNILNGKIKGWFMICTLLTGFSSKEGTYEFFRASPFLYLCYRSYENTQSRVIDIIFALLFLAHFILIVSIVDCLYFNFAIFNLSYPNQYWRN